MKLTNITEEGFFEVYKNWVHYGPGVMLIYQKPYPNKHVCEYVMFRQENSYNKTIINEDLLDLYNRGNE